MKQSRFKEQQIAYALRRAEGGGRVAEICRKLGVSEHTFYARRKKYAGMGVSEQRRIRQLEKENRRLKQVVGPVENAFMESFNGRLRDECLSGEIFRDLDAARTRPLEWKRDHNEDRPHSLAGIPPREFAEKWKTEAPRRAGFLNPQLAGCGARVNSEREKP